MCCNYTLIIRDKGPREVPLWLLWDSQSQRNRRRVGWSSPRKLSHGDMLVEKEEKCLCLSFNRTSQATSFFFPLSTTLLFIPCPSKSTIHPCAPSLPAVQLLYLKVRVEVENDALGRLGGRDDPAAVLMRRVLERVAGCGDVSGVACI